LDLRPSDPLLVLTQYVRHAKYFDEKCPGRKRPGHPFRPEAERSNQG
jgi:hypothetical protein